MALWLNEKTADNIVSLDGDLRCVSVFYLILALLKNWLNFASILYLCIFASYLMLAVTDSKCCFFQPITGW